MMQKRKKKMTSKESMIQAMIQAAVEAAKTVNMAVEKTENHVENSRTAQPTLRVSGSRLQQPTFNWKDQITSLS